jgi:hypothetical protein
MLAAQRRRGQLVRQDYRMADRYLPGLADAGLKASTITRRCAAIACAPQLVSLEIPTVVEPVRAVFRGFRRKIGTAVAREATARAIATILKKIPATPAGFARPRLAADRFCPLAYATWSAASKSS